MNATVRVSLVAVLCLAAAACAKKQTVKPAPPPPPPPPTTTTAPAPSNGKFTPADLKSNACLRKRTIYFAFNKYNIKPKFDQIVSCQAKYLRDRPTARVTLQGNTDDRGTREYNLGLGERRGKSVAQALEAAGASSDQITVISYGEERPVCHEQKESCWKLNRRVNIVYTVE